MKYRIKENTITFDALKNALEEEFGKKYQIKIRQKGMLTVVKSKTCATLVVPLHNKLIVKGGFPTMIGQMTFNLLVIGLGILPPLAVYYFVFHKKMKALENEVLVFIKEKYKDNILT